jgi:hypothetical protein
MIAKIFSLKCTYGNWVEVAALKGLVLSLEGEVTLACYSVRMGSDCITRARCKIKSLL